MLFRSHGKTLATTGFRIPRYWSMHRIDFVDDDGNEYRMLSRQDRQSSDSAAQGFHVRSPTHERVSFADSTGTITLRSAKDGQFAQRREFLIESFWDAPCGTHGLLWCKP